MSGTVLAMRHGETAWNREGRLQGWAPTGLTDRGREQARATGSEVATRHEVDRVVASDLRRCRETAALVREAGVTPEPRFERDWRERDAGVHQGLLAETVFERYPAFDSDSGRLAVESRPEGGESILEMRERVLAALADLPREGTALVVTHGGPVRVLLAAATGTDLPTALRRWSPANGSVTELRIGGDGLGLVRTDASV